MNGKNFADVESVANSDFSDTSRWMIGNSMTVNPVALLGMVTPGAELHGVTHLAKSNKLFSVQRL